MDIDRIFRKTALSFIILASKSAQPLSACEFFDKSFDLNEIESIHHDKYRDHWASVLMEQIDLLPQDKRKLITLAFVEPQPDEMGFSLLGDDFRLDIIAIKPR